LDHNFFGCSVGNGSSVGQVMSDNKGTRFYLLDYDFFVIFFYIHVWKTGRNQHMGYLKKQNINNNRMKGRVTKSRGGAAC
jgi:hypothetical protein